eukprot:gene3583-32548_t
MLLGHSRVYGDAVPLEGQYYVDFPLAQYVQGGGVPGSPPFLSPEG